MKEITSSILSVRVDATTKMRLEWLARNTGRTTSFLAAAAIRQYLGINEWQADGISAGIESVEDGAVTAHDEMLATESSLGSDAKLPIPVPTKP